MTPDDNGSGKLLRRTRFGCLDDFRKDFRREGELQPQDRSHEEKHSRSGFHNSSPCDQFQVTSRCTTISSPPSSISMIGSHPQNSDSMCLTPSTALPEISGKVIQGH